MCIDFLIFNMDKTDAFFRIFGRCYKKSIWKLWISTKSCIAAALGLSAGGHLRGCLGTLFDCPEVRDIALSAWIRPDALALCCPVTISQGKTHEMRFDKMFMRASSAPPEMKVF